MKLFGRQLFKGLSDVHATRDDMFGESPDCFCLSGGDGHFDLRLAAIVHVAHCMSQQFLNKSVKPIGGFFDIGKIFLI